MQRYELALLASLGALAVFVGSQTYATGQTSAHRTESVSSGAVSVAPSRAARARLADRAELATAELPAEVRSMTRDDVRQQLEYAGAQTYIDEILLDRDSALTRWPDRIERPLRVWIARGEALTGWKDRYVNEVAAAFNAWEDVGIPVRFTLAADSASADVYVGWTDRFREPISGKTVWSRDDRWWIVDADITLALHHRDGEALDAAQIRAIALHEIGHLLGLDHTGDPANVMAPRVRVRDLSIADRNTVRLLYSLPAGKISN
jgi:hypothetical protein